MKLHCYPDTDSLYIEMNAVPGVETREIVAGVNADFDAGGAIVGLDIDRASRTLDPGSVETVALPALTAKGRIAARPN